VQLSLVLHYPDLNHIWLKKAFRWWCGFQDSNTKLSFRCSFEEVLFVYSMIVHRHSRRALGLRRFYHSPLVKPFFTAGLLFNVSVRAGALSCFHSSIAFNVNVGALLWTFDKLGVHTHCLLIDVPLSSMVVRSQTSEFSSPTRTSFLLMTR
jgi:hypothetical protein